MEHVDVGILGAGSWGTALATLLAGNGHRVRLWSHLEEHASAVQRDRENKTYLPGFTLPDNIRVTSDPDEALDGAKLVLSVVPSHALRSVLDTCASKLPEGAPVLSCTKGIENDTLMMVSQIFEQHLPKEQHDRVTYLAGPSFAREVAAKRPTAVTVAGRDHDVCVEVQHHLRNEFTRVYTTDDVVGAELGGALKNVIAIAAGVADGMELGQNARAAIITRGLAEIGRLAEAMGAHPMTVMGLAGMGDLVLTCTGDLRRNRRVGLALGRGQTLQEILDSMNMVAEGVRTTKSTHDLAKREGIDMPITNTMYRILYEGQSPKSSVAELMTRRARPERDDHDA
ncbi:MAG: NAD(P)H-dependent glycerol-3-phosphate dehydrogenase [Sandaracinaceae bacterium]